MGFVGTLKDVVNALTDPRVFIPVVAFLFMLALRTRSLWRTGPALIAGLVAVAFVGVSMLDPNFGLIVKKPDNVPIVAMLFLVGFFLWLSMSQAYTNDDRITAGQPPREASDGEAEKTWVWPDLVYTELLAMVLGMIILVVWSLLLKAPIEEPANPARTMNPAKAPWYFLGLQEMLVYFDPWMAGVVFPTLIIVGLMAIPYIDTNPLGAGYYTINQRKHAIGAFCFGFFVLWITMIFIGTFIRGPSWMWFWPGQTWDPTRQIYETNRDLPDIFSITSMTGKMMFGAFAMALYF